MPKGQNAQGTKCPRDKMLKKFQKFVFFSKKLDFDHFDLKLDF